MSRYNDGFRQYDDYDDYDGRGNGYDYEAGMSNNALDAYERGVKPLSKISKADLSHAGWDETKNLAVALAREYFWVSQEWHHSGGQWFNKVKFYDPETLVGKWQKLDESQRQKWREKLRPRKKTKNQGRLVRGSYTIWGGSRRRPRRIGEQEFTGVLNGNWITLDSGGRKKADGRHITWEDAA